MNDLNLDNPAAVIAHVASALPLPASVQKAAETAGRAAYDAQIGSGSSTARRFALQNAIRAVRNYGRAVRKSSEADSLAGITSTDFDIGPATSNQTAEQETRTPVVQEIANTSGAVAQAFGIDPNDAANGAKMDAILRVVAEDYSYGAHESLDQMEARAAANARENGFVWSSDLADPRSNDDADSLNAGMGVESNFSGRRNDPRAVYSPAGPETGFSTSRGASVPGGSADGATVSEGSIASIAAAAYAQGFAQGRSAASSGGFSSPQSGATPSSNFAKAQRQRSLSAARRGGK